jgi:hypothetical protein
MIAVTASPRLDVPSRGCDDWDDHFAVWTASAGEAVTVVRRSGLFTKTIGTATTAKPHLGHDQILYAEARDREDRVKQAGFCCAKWRPVLGP